MKSVAFIISRQDLSELLEDDVLLPTVKGESNVKTVAFYFVGDGVYHLLKGSRYAKNLKAIIESKEIAVIANESSIRNRKLQNVVIDGIKMGVLKDFFNAALDANHIITF